MMPGDLDLAAEIQACLARLLAPHGLTIVHPFPVQLFNSQGCPPEHQLPSFDRSSTLGIVIGNTNALWSRFIQHLASQPESVLSQGNPLDHYVEAAVTQAIHQCSCLAGAEDDALGTSQPVPASSSRSSLQHIVRFSHHTEPGKFVNMLRAAQLSGLAYYSSTTHLCMHPEYGPWFALRAVAVFDTNGPDPSNVSELPCPYPDLEAAAAEQMRRLEALGDFSNWQQHWREWAALRALGGQHTDPRHAYSPEQLEYHYTKNKDVLRRAVAVLRRQQQQPGPDQHPYDPAATAEVSSDPQSGQQAGHQ